MTLLPHLLLLSLKLKFQAKKSEISFERPCLIYFLADACVKTIQTLKSGFPATAVGFIIVKPLSLSN